MPVDDMYQYSPSILTNILARRKAEERQTMLDDLQRRQAESQMSLNEENSQSLRMMREAEAKRDKAEAFDKWLGKLGPDVPLDEGGKSYLRENNMGGLIVPGLTPNVGVDETFSDFEGPRELPTGPPQPKSPDTFYGLPKDRKAAELQQMISGVVGNDSTNPAMRNALLYNQLTGGDNAPAEALRSNDGRLISIDRATGRSKIDPSISGLDKDTVSYWNSKTGQGGGNGQRAWQLNSRTGEDGKAIWEWANPYDPSQPARPYMTPGTQTPGQPAPPPAPAVGGTLNRVGTTVPKPLPTGIPEVYLAHKANLLKNPKTAPSAFDYAANSIMNIQMAGAEDDVKQFALRVVKGDLADALAGQTADQIATQASQENQFTPEEEQALRALIQFGRGF